MKNLKSFICNTAMLLLSVLFLVFMSQPHMTSMGISGSGYDCIDFSGNDAKMVIMAIGLLLATIIACLLILSSIYGILRCFDVIKSDKADKIIRLVNITLAIIAVVCMFLALIMDICIVVEANDNILGMTVLELGWAIGVNFVLSIGTLVATCLSNIGKKNKKAKKA